LSLGLEFVMFPLVPLSDRSLGLTLYATPLW
jgi:hypothetical protein